MEEQAPSHPQELVRCLDCGTEYYLPRGTVQADPCPRCGSVGWIAVKRVERAGEQK